MRKILFVASFCGLVALAMGAAPRYIEELRIGGGFGDSVDGGLDIDHTGAVATDGNVLCSGNLAVDGGTLSTTSATFNLLNGNATTVNFGGEADVNAGGSAKTVYVQGHMKVGHVFSMPTSTMFTANDTSPSVANGNVFKIPATWTTGNSITALDDGITGQRITVIGGDADCVFVDGGALKLAGNWTAVANYTLELLYDGSNWYELGRSGN